MRITEIISHYVGSLLAKQHPLFSCCASCGEIRTPVENRLCTSLSPAFQVDAVCLVSDTPDAHAWLRYTLRSLEYHAPGVQRVFLVAEGTLPDWLRRDAPGLCCAPEGFLASASAKKNPEALVHTLPDLAEHHVILSPRTVLSRPCLIQDFFTPNGIPLLFVAVKEAHPAASEAAQEGADNVETLESLGLQCVPGVFPQTGENAAALWDACTLGAFANEEIAFEKRRAWWGYTQGRAILHIPHSVPEFSLATAPSGRQRVNLPLFFQGRTGDTEAFSLLASLFPRCSRFEVV